MLCSRVKNQLSAFCDRELTGAEMLQIRRNLDGCPSCQQELDSVRQVKVLLGALAPSEPLRSFEPSMLDARRRPSPWAVALEALPRLQKSTGEWLAGWYSGSPAAQRATACAALCGALILGGVSNTLLRPSQPADAVTAMVPAGTAEEHPLPSLPPGLHLHLAHTGTAEPSPYRPVVVSLVSMGSHPQTFFHGDVERLYPGYAEPYPRRAHPSGAVMQTAGYFSDGSR